MARGIALTINRRKDPAMTMNTPVHNMILPNVPKNVINGASSLQ
jgi:hypothetical protein